MENLNKSFEYFHAFYGIYVIGKPGSVRFLTSKRILKSLPLPGHYPDDDLKNSWVEEGQNAIKQTLKELIEMMKWGQPPEIECLYSAPAKGLSNQEDVVEAICKVKGWEWPGPTYYLMLPDEKGLGQEEE